MTDDDVDFCPTCDADTRYTSDEICTCCGREWGHEGGTCRNRHVLHPADCAHTYCKTDEPGLHDYVAPRFAKDICPETEDGRHQVTEGSCDQCGAKNFD